MRFHISFLCFLFLLATLGSCSLDYDNPNAATETQVLSTKEGLIALSIGIQQLYSTQAYGTAILTPSVTTRETAITTTFANLEELENGGDDVSGENGYTSRLFTQMMRVKGMAESLIDAVPNVDLEAGTASGLTAWGHLFRAMTLGYLAHNFEQVPLVNSRENNAAYSPNEDAYEEAIRLLEEAVDLVTKTPISSEFQTRVLGMDISLINTLNAYLARYRLMAGDYQGAIDAAMAVDLDSKSVFAYDAQNTNPVYAGMFISVVSYAPRDNYGLPAELAPDPADQRYEFYMQPADALSLNNLPIEVMDAPFFNTVMSPIPVYRPGEMLLIKAEAHARLNQLAQAEDFLNQLLRKCPADDPLGLGACLPGNYTANGDQNALLAEIYKQRRIECYLCGTSLEDSRRFGRPQPTADPPLTAERNRNFYPYPAEERLNNPNTPPDPQL